MVLSASHTLFFISTSNSESRVVRSVPSSKKFHLANTAYINNFNIIQIRLDMFVNSERIRHDKKISKPILEKGTIRLFCNL